jgi:ribosomal protein L21
LSTDENRTSPNNERIEICMNDVIMEEEVEKNLNVQIGNPSVENKRNKNEEKETEEVIKINLKKLHVQKKSSKHHGNLFLC